MKSFKSYFYLTEAHHQHPNWDADWYPKVKKLLEDYLKLPNGLKEKGYSRSGTYVNFERIDHDTPNMWKCFRYDEKTEGLKEYAEHWKPRGNVIAPVILRDAEGNEYVTFGFTLLKKDNKEKLPDIHSGDDDLPQEGEWNFTDYAQRTSNNPDALSDYQKNKSGFVA